MRLIDELRRYADMYQNPKGPSGREIIGTAELLIAAADALEVQQQQWIPVTERLPAENGSYIVTACDEGSPAGEGIWYSTVVVVAEYYGGSWTWYDGCCEYSLEGIVTHWMPLPKPYKEEMNR